MARLVVAGLAIVFGLGLIRLSGIQGELLPLVVLLVVFPVVALIVGQLRKLLLVIILLGLPFPIDIHLFYDQELASLGAIGGLGISVTTLALTALYSLWIVDVLVIRRRGDGGSPGWSVRAARALLAYVSVVVASMLVAQNRAMAVNMVVILLQTLLLYLYLLHVIRGWRDVQFVLSILLLGLVIESAIILVSALVGDDLSIAFVQARVYGGSGRVGGTLGSHNAAGAYLSVMMALAMGVVLSSQRGLLRFGAMTGLMLGSIAIILTGSRGGWLALFVAAAFTFVYAWRRGWLPPAVPMAVVASALCLAVIFQSFLAQRLFPEDQSAALSRIPLMRLAGRIIVDNPVLGVGANNFAVRAAEYWPNRTIDDWLRVVHNTYLLIASEAGLLALAMFMLFLYLTIRYGLRTAQGHDRLLAPIALGLTAGVLGHMTHYMVDYFNRRGQLELLWVIAALIAAVYRIGPQSNLEDDGRDAGAVTLNEPYVDNSGDRARVSEPPRDPWRDGYY